MSRLTAIVLGSAAGGGFPQWNCRCDVCRLAWAGDARVSRRTQTSVAVSGDGVDWVLLDAAPDLTVQLGRTPALHANGDPRGSPIRAVVLTGAEIDSVLGLLSLRERHPLALYATAQTFRYLDENPMFEALGRDIVARREAAMDVSFPLPGGVEGILFAAPGKPPLYREAGAAAAADIPIDTNVGVELRREGARLIYLPGCAALTPAVKARLAEADMILFDGTLFTDDEMLRRGVGEKSGRRMGHMPIGGEDGSLRQLGVTGRRRAYIHINNTNPVLIEDSPERRQVEAAQWAIAEDGLRIEL